MSRLVPDIRLGEAPRPPGAGRPANAEACLNWVVGGAQKVLGC
jgi:hypothetical protein